MKIIQIWQNGGQLFSNIADWCHILSLTCSKGCQRLGSLRHIPVQGMTKLNNLHFLPLEVVSRYRDPQLQVSENYPYLFNLAKPLVCVLASLRHIKTLPVQAMTKLKKKFTHSKLCLATANHNFKGVKITHFCLVWPNYSIWISTNLKLFLADAINNFKWVKIIQIWQNRGQLFSNIADWCHILSLTCSKGCT